jgi:hypothetical protein
MIFCQEAEPRKVLIGVAIIALHTVSCARTHSYGVAAL